MRLLRMMLCSGVCALGLIATTPALAQAAPPISVVAPVADSFSWSQFVKFWKRQLDRTAGVVGVVFLVGAGAVLLILTKTRR
jgi:hypothetical protein